MCRKLLVVFCVCLLTFIVAEGQEEYLTRADFLKLSNDYLELVDYDQVHFEDVKKDYKNYKEIAKSVKIGIISGYSDNTIRPDKLITREEAGSIIDRIYKNESTSESIVIKDGDMLSTWSKNSIKRIVNSRVISLINGNFYPERKITLYEALKYFKNLESIMGKKLVIKEPGEYDLSGQVFNEVIINAENVVLKNIENIDLITLKSESIRIIDSDIKIISLRYKEKKLEIHNLKVNTSLDLLFEDNVFIESDNSSFDIYKTININKIILKGLYEDIKIIGNNSLIFIKEYSQIENLIIESSKKLIKVNNKLNSEITLLVVNNKSSFLGLGNIEYAEGDKLRESYFRRLPKNLRPKKIKIKKSETYRVEFYNFSGEVVKSQLVSKGESAVAPQLGLISDYVFCGWDKDFNNIYEELDVHPIYQKLDPTKEITIEDLGSRGKLTSVDNAYNIDDNSIFGYKTLIIRKSSMPYNLDRYEKFIYVMNNLTLEFEENMFDSDIIMVNISQFNSDQLIETSKLKASLN